SPMDRESAASSLPGQSRTSTMLQETRASLVLAIEEKPRACVLQPPGSGGWWVLVRDAIHGTRYDLTTGSINRAILILAIPMALEMALESFFAVADVFWVSRVGSDAVASVGLTEPILSILYAIGG